MENENLEAVLSKQTIGEKIKHAGRSAYIGIKTSSYLAKAGIIGAGVVGGWFQILAASSYDPQFPLISFFASGTGLIFWGIGADIIRNYKATSK